MQKTSFEFLFSLNTYKTHNNSNFPNRIFPIRTIKILTCSLKISQNVLYAVCIHYHLSTTQKNKNPTINIYNKPSIVLQFKEAYNVINNNHTTSKSRRFFLLLLVYLTINAVRRINNKQSHRLHKPTKTLIYLAMTRTLPSISLGVATC